MSRSCRTLSSIAFGGVSVGHGAVIAGGSIVIRDVDPDTLLVAGVRPRPNGGLVDRWSGASSSFATRSLVDFPAASTRSLVNA
jgi:tetrahydrodipicolinate N-succinyltransferase